MVVYAMLELVANALLYGKSTVHSTPPAPSSPPSSPTSNSIQENVSIIFSSKDINIAENENSNLNGGVASNPIDLVTKFVRIEVLDNGPGIPRAIENIIFKQPIQSDVLGKSESQSDGKKLCLGLYSVQMYMNLLNGYCGYVPSPNNTSKGSLFWVEFPADFTHYSQQVKRYQDILNEEDQRTQVLLNGAQSPSGIRLHSKSRPSLIQEPKQTYTNNMLDILVVDDNATIRMMLSRLLEKQSVHSVQTAENGKVAYELLTDGSKISVVFLDFLMPIMNGLEALQMFREWQNTHTKPNSKLPVFIGISANASDPDIERGKSLGMQYFVQKPITLKNLQDTLAEVVNYLNE